MNISLSDIISALIGLIPMALVFWWLIRQEIRRYTPKWGPQVVQQEIYDPYSVEALDASLRKYN